MSSRGGIQTGSGRKLLSPRSRLVSKEKKKKTKKRWEDEHRRQTIKQSRARKLDAQERKRRENEALLRFII